MVELSRIDVSADKPYPVIIGRGLIDLVPDFLVGAKKVLIIHPIALTVSAEALRDSLVERGFEAILAGVPDSEEAKRIEVAAFCWGILGKAEFSRTDFIIGFGGGTATDLAGYVAACWLRGVGIIQIPTTLLGMVDAAVGGKTGVNTAEGKNLVGAFHSPVAVIADLDTLESLPKNDLVAGFAEVVKCGFIRDTQILDLIEQDFVSAINTKSDSFVDLVRRAIEVKAKIVGADFRESGERELLNYGHTLGHAIELAERYKWRHGAAISIGMVFVAELARINGRLSMEAVERHRNILTMLGLPISYPASKWPVLLANMQIDKKARAGSLRFVVLDEIGKPTIMQAPTDEMLFAAFGEIAS
ncbi:MAG: 3-dehydroquinate synthase [Actinomycetota bacterium]